jgi:hypothetical protein
LQESPNQASGFIYHYMQIETSNAELSTLDLHTGLLSSVNGQDPGYYAIYLTNGGAQYLHFAQPGAGLVNTVLMVSTITGINLTCTGNGTLVTFSVSSAFNTILVNDNADDYPVVTFAVGFV